MSADNWRRCPQCLVNASTFKAKAIADAESAYGKVPASEYLALLKEAERATPKLGETLREDYEILVDSAGNFRVSYGCSCDNCGLHFEFEHQETVPVKGASK